MTTVETEHLEYIPMERFKELAKKIKDHEGIGHMTSLNRLARLLGFEHYEQYLDTVKNTDPYWSHLVELSQKHIERKKAKKERNLAKRKKK